MFGGPAIIMPHTARYIADPGTRHLRHTARANQHIGGNIRYRRDHIQPAPALADQFMGCGKRHSVLQRRPQHDLTAVLYEFGNGIMDARQLLTVDGSSPPKNT